MASGGGDSSAAVAIAHRVPGSQTAILDLLRERKPPFIAYEVIADWVKILKAYNIGEIWLDGYGFKYFQDEWRKHNIIARKGDSSTAENYAHGQPLMLGGRMRLLDHGELCNQLLSLERSTVDGPEKIETNAHDDVAAAAIGALVTCHHNHYDRFYRGFQPDADQPRPAAPAPFPREVFANANWHKSWMYQLPQTTIPSADDNLRNLYNAINIAARWVK
jgi:hypothetical protein